MDLTEDYHLQRDLKKTYSKHPNVRQQQRKSQFYLKYLMCFECTDYKCHGWLSYPVVLRSDLNSSCFILEV